MGWGVRRATSSHPRSPPTRPEPARRSRPRPPAPRRLPRNPSREPGTARRGRRAGAGRGARWGPPTLPCTPGGAGRSRGAGRGATPGAPPRFPTPPGELAATGGLGGGPRFLAPSGELAAAGGRRWGAPTFPGTPQGSWPQPGGSAGAGRGTPLGAPGGSAGEQGQARTLSCTSLTLRSPSCAHLEHEPQQEDHRHTRDDVRVILHDEFMAQDRGALGALLANRHGAAAARACRCSARAPLFAAAAHGLAAAAAPRLLLTAPPQPLAGASLPIPQPVRSRRGRPEKQKKKVSPQRRRACAAGRRRSRVPRPPRRAHSATCGPEVGGRWVGAAAASAPCSRPGREGGGGMGGRLRRELLEAAAAPRAAARGVRPAAGMPCRPPAITGFVANPTDTRRMVGS